MFEEHFSKSITDLDIVEYNGEQECETGSYYQEGWKKTTMKKVDVFIKACTENQNDIFVFSDVDIQFFGDLKDTLIEELGDYDIAIQNDYLGGMCSGFFVCRGNQRTLKMFQSMKDNESHYHEDQHALNMNLGLVNYKPLSERFWTFGMYRTQWKGQNFDIPENILMHHANWTEGIDNKISLLKVVRDKFEKKQIVKSNIDNYQSFLNDYFKEFRPNPTYPVYPPYHTGNYLEDYFFDYFNENSTKSDVYYIPVSWTTCYIENKNLPLLQEKLLSLDKSKSYFAVSQHDDAIKEHLPPNTKKFCAGGNQGGIPLPLICSRIPNQQDLCKINKEIFCSFVGSITHPIRQSMVKLLEGDTKYKLTYRYWTNNVSKNDMDNFIFTTANSKFTLCPRGYGKNSFRTYESMQLGSIPVYIYDDDWRPFKDFINWDEFSVSIHHTKLPKLKEILESFTPQQIELMSENCKIFYEKYFTLESVSKIILLNI